MSGMTRREFLGYAGAAAVLGAAGRARAAGSGARVVVVGGGFGGATCAKYLRAIDPSLRVTLVEPKKEYVTCPFSNLLLGGVPGVTLQSLTQGYEALRSRHGVEVLHDTATALDPVGRKVTLAGGAALPYDRLVVSPGIAFKWGALPGYDAAAVEAMPHAWQAGPQTMLLRRRLEAMKDGGVFVIVVPPNPFRCPPGPYERASLVAHYLKAHKPRSKVLILDPKEAFPKQALFTDGWKSRYGDLIEWVPGSKGGKVASVDAKAGAVEAGSGRILADVANVIPPQTAGEFALRAGLAGASGFCPVDARTFESTVLPGVHVIGDASIAGDLPKSGFAASSEGKVAARAVVAALRGEPPAEASFVNTCYSLIGPGYGISVAGVYRVIDDELTAVEGAGGVSPRDASPDFRKDEADYAFGWYKSITADIWG